VPVSTLSFFDALRVRKTFKDFPNIMTEDHPPTKRLKASQPVQVVPEWRIYPPKRPTFQVGDDVLIKSTNDTKRTIQRGTIITGARSADKDKDNTTANKIRVRVRVADAEYCLKPKEQRKRLLPYFGGAKQKSTTIVVTPETNFFRQLVPHVEPTDIVLEIGCSTGETSKLLIPLCRSYVGLDNSQEMLAKCRNQIPTTATNDCHLAVVDALVDPRKGLQECQTYGTPSVVFMDIGGNRECINVLRMLSWVLQEFEPRLVVVKSRELVQSIKSSSAASVDASTGIIQNGQAWFQSHRQKRALPKHPLKAPLVMSPKDPQSPICRYHNYHKKGCAKADCPLDHDHCHACLQFGGHVALDCPTLSSSSSSPPLSQTNNSTRRRRRRTPDSKN
jgi:SAM-dependent methyltransferase